MNQNVYAGVLQNPSDNFSAVRDRRRATPFYYDIDLTTARSISAGTALALNFAGNAFYCDANPSDGSALVHFQDTSLDRATVPLFVSPGAIFKIPFTQILIENNAQVGKKIRIVYGVDIDFQPGSVAQQSISGSISTIEAVYGKAALSQAFSCPVAAPAVAAVNPQCAVWNPAGSGEYFYVDEVTVINSGAAATPILVQQITALGNLVLYVANSINKFEGGPNGSGAGYSNTALASTATTVSVYVGANVGALSSYTFKFASPIVIPPGFGLASTAQVPNQALAAYYQYTKN